MVIKFEGFHKWYVTIWGLNNVYRQVLNVVFVILGLNLATNLDSFLNVTSWILLIIILLRQLEVGPLWLLN